ncbi:DMT family transporter [Sediminibacillus albus]|uniref:Permease of the drug/metabolite transporter (DMT) superfamily n=1 Tax=Sediminibacillus albus TaxID=407036 RepID=A0A1G8X2U4_9BACI|nr:DMT family transporter [Sediminibacillus albus]SDJ84764.1 Permease of the drug/metabolite transporter (DMT) superfamily [Sediminibacillus albus]
MKAYLFLLIVMMIFSSNLLIGKGINELPPFTIAFFRFVVAFLVLLPLGWKSFKQNIPLWKKEWKALLSLALFGMAFFNALVYASLQYTTSTNVAIIEATTPVFTIGLGLLFLKREQLTLNQTIGVILSLAGAIWVIANGSLAVIYHLQFNIGDLLMVGAVIVWAVYSILVKRHNAKFPTYGGLLVMYAIAAACLFPLAFSEWIVSAPSISGKQMLSLLHLGIFPSVIALILWNRAVEEVGPSQASIFFNFLPIFTMIGAALFLGEQIRLVQVIGVTLVIAGVYLSTRSKKRRKINNSARAGN